MKYMLLMVDDGTATDSPTEIARMPEFIRWRDEMDSRGVRHLGARLRGPEAATSVRVRDGQVLVTDGPFAETREQIGGFEIVDCADLAEAIEVAGKHPSALRYTVDVRPFWTDMEDER